MELLCIAALILLACLIYPFLKIYMAQGDK